MGKILKSIDQIGREKQKTVYIIQFDKKVFKAYDYENYPNRKELLKYLDENKIAYDECFAYASDTSYERYRGQINLVDLNKDDDKYVLLDKYLEPEKSVLRFEGIQLWSLPLELSMKNAYMDEPDYVPTVFS